MDLYKKSEAATRWASFENPAAAPGGGARTNKGAKGNPWEALMPGEVKTLLDTEGCGIIRRFWATVTDRTPRMLRGLRLDMYWDNADRPAVSSPLGDFFGVGLGCRTPFENALFSDPEGRSFNCIIPMPFRSRARITITNETETPCRHLFYDINFERCDSHPSDVLYFHSHWRRERPTILGRDYEILPLVRGSGRFLGSNLGVIADERYGDSWWGEGEVKGYLDGDTEFPTLVGTGTEDYIGTGWGQGAYINRYQGCAIADPKNRQWAFYRYHVPDPVNFQESCRITIQQIGGGDKEMVNDLLRAGAPVIPITVSQNDKFTRLLDLSPVPALSDFDMPEGWCNYYRQDDWSSVAYFYLESATSDLPPLAPWEERVAGLLDVND